MLSCVCRVVGRRGNKRRRGRRDKGHGEIQSPDKMQSPDTMIRDEIDEGRKGRFLRGDTRSKGTLRGGTKLSVGCGLREYYLLVS